MLTYLRAVECPCLVVRGQAGIVTDTAEHLARKQAFKRPLREVILPGSHHPHVSSARGRVIPRFNDQVEFLKKEICLKLASFSTNENCSFKKVDQ